MLKWFDNKSRIIWHSSMIFEQTLRHIHLWEMKTKFLILMTGSWIIGSVICWKWIYVSWKGNKWLFYKYRAHRHFYDYVVLLVVSHWPVNQFSIILEKNDPEYPSTQPSILHYNYLLVQHLLNDITLFTNLKRGEKSGAKLWFPYIRSKLNETCFKKVYWNPWQFGDWEIIV